MPKLSSKQEERVEVAIILMLLESRKDSALLILKGVKGFDINDPCYCEAFGIIRGLEAAGYGKILSDNTPANKENLKWWLGELKNKALEIEEEKGIEVALSDYRERYRRLISRKRIG